MKHNIIKVLEHYGAQQIPERPGWNKLKCPFHDDSHASATVNIDQQAFICFGCGVKGDVYTIIMQQEGIQFREAITFAERVTGESNDSLSKLNTPSRRLSSNSGIIAKRRGYSPPRSRGRASNRARSV